MSLLKKLLILFLILIVLYFIFDKIAMPIYTRHGQAIEVPDLSGLFYEDARDKLEAIDLKIVESTKKFDANNEFPIGTIMLQNPKANAVVKKGRRIYVVVSKGEPTMEMPNLIRRSERNAVFMLKNLGLQVRNIRYEHSEIYHSGVVSDQSIPEGIEVKTGTQVDLVVSMGQFPDKFVVPALINRSLGDAKKLIIQAGLTLGEIRYEIMDELLPDTVIEQTPEANTEVNQGDPINLIVSKLPDKTEGIN